MIFFCKYDVVISDILEGFFLDVFYCLLAVIYQSFMRNQEGKIGLQKKVHRRICARDITFLTARPPLSYIIFCFFLPLLPPSFLYGPASVYVIDATCFDECFLIPWDNWRTLFFLNVCRYFEVFSTIISLFSLKQCFERSPYFTFYQYYLHNNSAVLIRKF